MLPRVTSTLVLLPAATKLGQGNVFTGVCDSVQGVCVSGTSPQTRYTPPWDQVPPQDQVPPGPGTPPDQVHPPRPGTPRLRPGTPPGTRYSPRNQVHPPGTRYTPKTRVFFQIFL